MRFVIGITAVFLLAGSYLICPDALRTQINDTVTPDEQLLVDLEAGISALMRHLDGPGELGPAAPV